PDEGRGTGFAVVPAGFSCAITVQAYVVVHNVVPAGYTFRCRSKLQAEFYAKFYEKFTSEKG
ncbi:MAG: hypothetical protein ACI9Z9_002720, partial [Litorivivens sp.]